MTLSDDERIAALEKLHAAVAVTNDVVIPRLLELLCCRVDRVDPITFSDADVDEFLRCCEVRGNPSGTD